MIKRNYNNTLKTRFEITPFEHVLSYVASLKDVVSCYSDRGTKPNLRDDFDFLDEEITLGISERIQIEHKADDMAKKFSSNLNF